jgi:hypothetical protein
LRAPGREFAPYPDRRRRETEGLVDQLVQIAGSLLVLAGFVASQRGWVGTDSRVYLTLNLVGAGVLAVLAAMELQLGFLLLEGSWAVIAAYALLRLMPSGR